VTHRFLIVRLGSLGDVVHGIPTAAALRAHFPDARIDWLVDSRYVELLERVPALNARIGVDTRRVGDTMRTLGDLRGVRYHASIDLQGLVKSAVLARLVGAERTIGFPKAHLREPLARVLYSQSADPGGAAHVIHKNLALLAPLGVRDPRVEFPLDVPVTAAAQRVASRAGARGYALINPGAAWPNKRWPPDRFGALAARLRERHGLPSIVLWGPGEEALAESVVSSSQGAAEAAPPTTITDLFAIARHAALLVSGDTGPLHIGAASGTPIVALFGPTFAERNGPWSASDVVLSRAGQCSCHYARRCRTGQRCIDDITVDEVARAAERRLASGGRA
jgi:heptosyltransferase-1